MHLVLSLVMFLGAISKTPSISIKPQVVKVYSDSGNAYIMIHKVKNFMDTKEDWGEIAKYIMLNTPPSSIVSMFFFVYDTDSSIVSDSLMKTKDFEEGFNYIVRSNPKIIAIYVSFLNSRLAYFIRYPDLARVQGLLKK